MFSFDRFSIAPVVKGRLVLSEGESVSVKTVLLLAAPYIFHKFIRCVFENKVGPARIFKSGWKVYKNLKRLFFMEYVLPLEILEARIYARHYGCVIRPNFGRCWLSNITSKRFSPIWEA